MDTVYYTSVTIMTVLILALPLLTVIFLIKPHFLNDRKVVRKEFSRPKILLVGFISTVAVLFGFSPVISATEPASVKDARIIRELATKKAQEEATKAKKVRDAAKDTIIKQETEVEPIPFETRKEESGALAKGESRVAAEGSDGERTVYYTVTYVEGKETARSVTKEVTTKEPVAKVVTIGTYVAPISVKRSATPAHADSSTQDKSSCNPNYSGCVPNVSYDLDCPDIGYKVQVLGYDQYKLDRDKDGWGCESY